MSAKISLTAEVRGQFGKRPSRRLRRLENKVLANVYGAQKESTPIVLEHHKVNKAMENEAFFSSILTLNINGEPEKVVIKAIQRHPYKPRILHMDFYRINLNEKLNMHIPLHFIGDTQVPGVKAGGVISRSMNEVEVRCLPADLPEYIEVDLSQMQLDEYIYLSDLKLPTGVELAAFTHGNIEDHNQPVVNIHMPHVVEEPVEGAPVSPEVEATKVSAEGKADAEEAKK